MCFLLSQGHLAPRAWIVGQPDPGPAAWHSPNAAGVTATAQDLRLLLKISSQEEASAIR